jgi:hypothetical protein
MWQGDRGKQLTYGGEEDSSDVKLKESLAADVTAAVIDTMRKKRSFNDTTRHSRTLEQLRLSFVPKSNGWPGQNSRKQNQV